MPSCPRGVNTINEITAGVLGREEGFLRKFTLGLRNLTLEFRNLTLELRNFTLGLRNLTLELRNLTLKLRNFTLSLRNLSIGLRNPGIEIFFGGFFCLNSDFWDYGINKVSRQGARGRSPLAPLDKGGIRKRVSR